MEFSGTSFEFPQGVLDIGQSLMSNKKTLCQFLIPCNRVGFPKFFSTRRGEAAELSQTRVRHLLAAVQIQRLQRGEATEVGQPRVRHLSAVV
jgi:hypothetical protein